MKNESPDPFKNHKYINLTTFRKNGKAVPTPVWFVIRDDRLYVHTGGQTGKAKRIRANGRAQIAPSDARGSTHGDFIGASGHVIKDPGLQREIRAAFGEKYGFQFRMMNLFSPLRRRRIGDAVTIELKLHKNGQGEKVDRGGKA